MASSRLCPLLRKMDIRKITSPVYLQKYIHVNCHIPTQVISSLGVPKISGFQSMVFEGVPAYVEHKKRVKINSTFGSLWGGKRGEEKVILREETIRERIVIL